MAVVEVLCLRLHPQLCVGDDVSRPLICGRLEAGAWFVASAKDRRRRTPARLAVIRAGYGPLSWQVLTAASFCGGGRVLLAAERGPAVRCTDGSWAASTVAGWTV